MWVSIVITRVPFSTTNLLQNISASQKKKFGVFSIKVSVKVHPSKSTVSQILAIGKRNPKKRGKVKFGKMIFCSADRKEGG